MTKKVEIEYDEIDVIMQAYSETSKKINDIALALVEKYEGGMSMNTALTTAKDYYQFGVLAMAMDTSLRKSAEDSVKKALKDKAARKKKKADKLDRLAKADAERSKEIEARA